MFGFPWRKNKRGSGTADTFVEATGGGWSDPPEILAGDGGPHADFVGKTLARARAYALENNIPVGQEFEFTITGIPVGILGPNEIVFGLITRAGEYGLIPGTIANETASFTLLE